MQLSYSWFLIVYPLIGIILLWLSWMFIVTPDRISTYIIKTAKSGDKPRLVLRWLKYFTMLAFISALIASLGMMIREIFFSAGCLIMVFIFGRLLLYWEHVKDILPEKQATINKLARKSGIMMFMMSVLCGIFWYMLVS